MIDTAWGKEAESKLVVYYLGCNVPGCHTAFRAAFSRGAGLESKVRALAKSEGWTTEIHEKTNTIMDVCPVCQDRITQGFIAKTSPTRIYDFED
jgi:hypothetical protein